MSASPGRITNSFLFLWKHLKISEMLLLSFWLFEALKKMEIRTVFLE